LELSEDLRCLAVARLGSNVIFGSQTVPLNNPLNGHPDALVYPLTCEEGLTSARLVLNEKKREAKRIVQCPFFPRETTKRDCSPWSEKLLNETLHGGVPRLVKTRDFV
jgi:hypothetical protein